MCLDLIFTKDDEDVQIQTSLPPLCSSDHTVLHWWNFLPNEVPRIAPGKHHNIRKAIFVGMRYAAANIQWELEDIVSADHAWLHVRSVIRD